MKVATVSATLLVMIFLLTFSSGNGQTFQYSRGWTNGKRSDPFQMYGKHTDAPWNPEDVAARFRQWELSRVLARLPPTAYHVYAYDLTPSGSTAHSAASIPSNLYQRPQVKHEADLTVANDLSPANPNEIADRFKRKSDAEGVLA